MKTTLLFVCFSTLLLVARGQNTLEMPSQKVPEEIQIQLENGTYAKLKALALEKASRMNQLGTYYMYALPDSMNKVGFDNNSSESIVDVWSYLPNAGKPPYCPMLFYYVTVDDQAIFVAFDKEKKGYSKMIRPILEEMLRR